MIYKLEKLEDYHLKWDEEDKIKMKETEEERKKQAELKKKKKKEMDIIEEKPGEEEEEEEKEDKDATKEQKMVKKIEKERGGGSERQNLITLEPENQKNEEEVETTLFKGLVPGLSQIDIKFLPVSDPVEKLSKKKKFLEAFDIISNGFLAALDLREDHILKLMKPGCLIYQENCHFLTPLEAKIRPDAKKSMLKNITKGLKTYNTDYKSQFIFEIDNPEPLKAE